MDYRRGTREFSGVMQLSYIFFFLYSDGSGSYTTNYVCLPTFTEPHTKKVAFHCMYSIFKIGGWGNGENKITLCWRQYLRAPVWHIELDLLKTQHQNSAFYLSPRPHTNYCFGISCQTSPNFPSIQGRNSDPLSRVSVTPEVTHLPSSQNARWGHWLTRGNASWRPDPTSRPETHHPTIIHESNLMPKPDPTDSETRRRHDSWAYVAIDRDCKCLQKDPALTADLSRLGLNLPYSCGAQAEQTPIAGTAAVVILTVWFAPALLTNRDVDARFARAFTFFLLVLVFNSWWKTQINAEWTVTNTSWLFFDLCKKKYFFYLFGFLAGWFWKKLRENPDPRWESFDYKLLLLTWTET